MQGQTKRSRLRKAVGILLYSSCSLLLAITAAAATTDTTSYASLSRSQVHAVLVDLYKNGQYAELERVAQQVIEQNPIASQQSEYTSVYEYMGVAQYALGELDKAIVTFKRAVHVDHDDVVSWVHLGSCYLYNLQLPQSIRAFEVAVIEKGATQYLHQLVKARNWIASWNDRDELLAQVEAKFHEDQAIGRDPWATALDFVELAPAVLKYIATHSIRSEPRARHALCCGGNHQQPRELILRTPNLRLGFVSSDFGVHPVVTLMRGLLEMLAKDNEQQITVYCFSLTAATSWWKRNITHSVDHMVSLLGKDPREAAAIVHSHDIHVLIDLNGHTLHSGLSIFAYRPAPVQISFLGYPMTTGNPHIDFFISDPVTTPPEICDDLFTEKMLLLPTHYIVNDHMQMMGHTMRGHRPSLSEIAPHFTAQYNATPPFVFATFSNWQKMDPYVFSAWMAILARVPMSVMLFIRSKGHAVAEANLREEACAHGIDGHRRLVFADYQPWLHHTHGKRAADVVLDTTLKNGHTTILDALFAGVPVVTLEGDRMSNRAASSALHALRLHELTVNSIKEYVDVAVLLATDRPLLERLRATTEQHRLAFPLFDTRTFTSQFATAMRSAWHVGKSQRQRNASSATDFIQKMHLFAPVQEATTMVPRFFAVHDALGDNETDDLYERRVQSALVDGEHILLHIGGQVAREGWWIVNIEDHQRVDFVMPMDKLHPFPESSVAAIYASHVLEHVHFGVEEDVRHTLTEWFRVLRPGGSLLVAVPDVAILSTLFLNDTLSEQERFSVMRMMYGGQINVYDVHKVGFNFAFLSSFLQTAGFCEIERVDQFGLFPDASEAAFHGVPISLNVMARACKPGGDWIQTHLESDHRTSTQRQ